MSAIQDKWNRRYQSAGNTAKFNACEALVEHLSLLPHNGEALDLACGLGANALLMAEQGLNVSAWDISNVAIKKLLIAAKMRQVSIQAQVRDVTTAPPDANHFDVIVVSRFLHRPFIPQLIDALKKNGLIFYQTFTQDNQGSCGPANPDFLLKPNELLHLFANLRLLAYQEPVNVGNQAIPLTGQAYIVAQKTAK